MSFLFPFQGAKTETDLINDKIAEDAVNFITDREVLAKEVSKFLDSDKRQWMVDGELYYQGEQQILNEARTFIGESGGLQIVKNLPDYRIVDNQYAKLVDQKTNYSLGKPFTISTDDDSYSEALRVVLNRRFQKQLKETLQNSLNGGVGWLYPFYNSRGELTFKNFAPYEIIPYYNEEDPTILDYGVRVYTVNEYDGDREIEVTRVEVYSTEGIDHYIYDKYKLIDDIERPRESYITLQTPTEEGIVEEGYNWNRVPLIPFRFNSKEIPLIKRVKSLQDALNKIISMYQNNMLEDSRNTILVIKNYDGQDLSEFRRNLNAFGAVKIRNTPDAPGGIDTISVEVNAQNYESILKVLKSAIVENGRGFDAKDDRMSNNPNQMNIQSMYSDIELDANGIDTEYQAAFEELLWFVNQHLSNVGAGDFEGTPVDIIFNRDMLSNEKEIIDALVASASILSQETLIEQHPYVRDVKTEIDRKLSEENRALEATNPYGQSFTEVIE